jgi:membrane protease YdiL (CAAX protease family)
MNAREAAGDVAVVLAAIGVAWGASRLLIYPALSIPDNAPVILRPIAGFFVAWWLLYRRKLGWDSLGLRKPERWWRVAAGAVALYLTNMALAEWVVPWFAQVFHPQLQPTFLLYIRGDLPSLLAWIAIGWIVGGFMEECLFRGFLLTRIAQLCGGGNAALAVGIVAQALLFGSMHLYGGAFAFAYATAFALAAGIFYLLLGRNLWALIAVHGIWNTVAIWGVYAN